jgi:hypothetical protein
MVSNKQQSIVRAENTLRILAFFDAITSIILLLIVRYLDTSEDGWYFLQIPHFATSLTAFLISWGRERSYFVFGSVFFGIAFVLDVLGVLMRILWFIDCWEQVAVDCMSFVFDNLVGLVPLVILSVISLVYFLMSLRLMNSFEPTKHGKRS